VQENRHLDSRVARRSGRVIVGQEQLVERLLVGLLANGHVLLEAARPGQDAFRPHARGGGAGEFPAHPIHADCCPPTSWQFIYSPQDGNITSPSPVFANFVLADEINRAPAKVQSALLEAMQERQVTLARNTQAAVAVLVLATETD